MTMAELAAEHAVALRDAFAAPVDLVGTSTGGSIAAQLSADHGELVGRAPGHVPPMRQSKREVSTVEAPSPWPAASALPSHAQIHLFSRVIISLPVGHHHRAERTPY